MTSILGKRKFDDESVSDDYNNHSSAKRQRRNHNGHYSAPCAPSNYIYRDLEVVWARLEDFPWWPAQCDFTLLERDRGERHTTRLPVRWFGEDHNRVDWLTRDRVIPFTLEIEGDLQRQLKVEAEDEPEYNASLEDAVLRQKKWFKDCEKERLRHKQSDEDEDFDPSEFKRKRRRHGNASSENESDEDEDEESDEDDDEDDFEVDANGCIVDPEMERKKEAKRRRMQKRRLAAGDNESEMEDEMDEDEDENADIDLFDDVGDVEKGYLNDPSLKGDNSQFVVLNESHYFEQQKENERVKAIQLEQQREAMERQRVLEQQLVMQQQYALQQQQLAAQQQREQQQQHALNTYYNGLQHGYAQAAAAMNTLQNTGHDIHQIVSQNMENMNAATSFYPQQQQQQQAQNVNGQNMEIPSHQTQQTMNNNNHSNHSNNDMIQIENAQQNIQNVEEKVAKKKKKRKKKKKESMPKENEQVEVIELEIPKRSGKSLEEILNESEYSNKLQEISDLNALSLPKDEDKKDKVRILKGLPYQLQQEIMTDGYMNKTPSVLTEYFVHRETLKNNENNNKNNENVMAYYPSHYNRMQNKQMRDRRISNYASPKTKKRSLRTLNSNTNGKKSEPAYLRVASPEILEKMHFSQNTRSALTLDHIVTKQYKKSRGRKSGFFGKRKKRKLTAAKEEKKEIVVVDKVKEKNEESKEKEKEKEVENKEEKAEIDVNNEKKEEEKEVKEVEQQIEAMNVENETKENKEEKSDKMDVIEPPNISIEETEEDTKKANEKEEKKEKERDLCDKQDENMKRTEEDTVNDIDIGIDIDIETNEPPPIIDEAEEKKAEEIDDEMKESSMNDELDSNQEENVIFTGSQEF